MSSSPLTRDNDYQFPPAPIRQVITRAIWNFVMADLSSRIRGVEAKGTELDDLITDLSFNGQVRIDAAITPLIETVRADLVTLSSAVATAVTDASDAAASVAAEVRARVSVIEGNVDVLEAAFAQIVSGGAPAAMVSLTAIEGFAPVNAQSAIEALVQAVAAIPGKADAEATDERFALVEGRLGDLIYYGGLA